VRYAHPHLLPQPHWFPHPHPSPSCNITPRAVMSTGVNTTKLTSQRTLFLMRRVYCAKICFIIFFILFNSTVPSKNRQESYPQGIARLRPAGGLNPLWLRHLPLGRGRQYSPQREGLILPLPRGRCPKDRGGYSLHQSESTHTEPLLAPPPGEDPGKYFFITPQYLSKNWSAFQPSHYRLPLHTQYHPHHPTDQKTPYRHHC